ncbi:MAG: hypothetical protein JXR12_05790 [Neptunomonas phycophila]|uniref:hypothetical protein n=1 Tax=Neptunomonas phycophila TaxID=1572645 RepID=UPI003B8E8E4A
MIFNEQRPIALKELEFPTPDLYPTRMFKHADINFAYENSNDYVKYVLDSVKTENKHRRILVDVKVHNLSVGEYPCLPGWHCDTTAFIDEKGKPENLYLIAVGDNRTEFLANPFEWNSDTMDQRKIARHIPKDAPVVSIPNSTICKFGRYDFHRGPCSTVAGTRILIRVLESDIVTPRNKSFECNSFYK